MPAAACFVVTGPLGPVAGSCYYDPIFQALTFTPAEPLLPQTSYTVTASGLVDEHGDVQQVPFTSTFKTGGEVHIFMPLIFK